MISWCAGGLYQFPGLGKFSFSRHDLMNLNREAPKRTGISSVHHANCDFGDSCHLFVQEIMRSSPVPTSPTKLRLVHSIWLRDKSGCVTMDTSDCTFSKTIKSLGSNYDDMANGLLADKKHEASEGCWMGDKGCLYTIPYGSAPFGRCWYSCIQYIIHPPLNLI